MPKRAAVIEAEIDRRLAAAVAPEALNVICGREVRDWAREYLAEKDEEYQTIPDAASFVHYNLWGIDAVYQDALFVVLIFRVEGIEFFCGTGESFAFITYSQHEDPNPDEVYRDMAQRFFIPQPPLYIERRAAAIWLGRGWKP